LVRQF